ncbi:Chromate resistance protein ChrB [Nonomuraea angiospora]|uniref:Chromate resistance protein ChrB n=1 Tax=Nonomuraea angiospora TaxID=46172 RepID=UPI00344EE0AF
MASGERFLLLVYRVPSTTSRARVTVWRELKRMGALYVQQVVCVLPDRPGVRERLDKIRARIGELEGESMRFVLGDIEERDWMGAPGRDEATAKVAECEQLLEQDVYEREGGSGQG